MKFTCSYFGNRTVRHVAADMRSLARQGFTAVLHTFSEFDLMFHRGTMRDIVAATRDAGLEAQLDPWGVGKVFGGEPFSQFVTQHLADACQVLDDGGVAPLACPNAPAFRDYMRLWIEAAAETGAEVLFWDEPHFHSPAFLGGRPGRWGCRCEHCRERYERTHGAPMPRRETEDVLRFKTESLLDLLRMLLRASARAGRRNHLYLSPHIAPAEAPRAWRPFARLPHLETLGTGPYWQWMNFPIERVAEYARAVKEICGRAGLESQLWIQGCKIPRGCEGEIARAIDMACDAGIEHLAVWGFEGCACESWIACEDPPAAWRAVLRGFRRARRMKNQQAS